MFLRKLAIALALLPPFIWIIWHGGLPFEILFLVFAVVAADEVMSLGRDGPRSLVAWVAPPATLLVLAPVTCPDMPWTMQEGLLFALVVLFLASLAQPTDMKQAAPRLNQAMFAVIYASIPISFLIALRALPVNGRGLTFLALATSFLCDTFAYAGGRAFGKHKLYPLVSPNKTVEGLLTGMTAAALGAWATVAIFSIPMSVLAALALGFFAGLWGQIGDLSESLLKRSYAVKDAGKLLGSHGGALDRFDAVLFVAPLVYFASRWLM